MENLESLHLKYGDKISTYNVEFLQYSGQLNWGDAVFAHWYYKGLPNCLQDQISLCKAGKPGTFQEMMCITTAYDDCHWECEHEKECTCTCSNQPTASSDKSRKGQQQQQQNNSRFSNNPQSSGNKPNNPSSTSNNNNNNSRPLLRNPALPSSTAPSNTASSSFSSSQPAPPKKDLSGLLNKDGKLTDAEQQCRINNNLCIYCGFASHQVENCKKKKANEKAKGRRVEATAGYSATAMLQLTVSGPTQGSEK